LLELQYFHLITYSTKLELTKLKESGFEEVDWLDKMMLLAAIAGVGLVGAYLVYFNFL
jgi:hypothetical protein